MREKLLLNVVVAWNLRMRTDQLLRWLRLLLNYFLKGVEVVLTRPIRLMLSSLAELLWDSVSN
jgi:hypothetical protein